MGFGIHLEWIQLNRIGLQNGRILSYLEPIAIWINRYSNGADKQPEAVCNLLVKITV